MPIKFQEEHFTVHDVASARGITVQAVRKAIAECRIAAKKIAGVWFISRRELEERKWIRRGER